jgi:hypothetical protein
VGIDRGVAVSAALSTGEMLHAPGLTARERIRLRRMQRMLAGKPVSAAHYRGCRAGRRARSARPAIQPDTPGVQGEQSKQNPQLAAADVDQASRLVAHLKRA